MNQKRISLVYLGCEVVLRCVLDELVSYINGGKGLNVIQVYLGALASI